MKGFQNLFQEEKIQKMMILILIKEIMLGMYAEFSLAILSDYSYVIIHFSFQQRTTNDLDMRRRTPSYTWHYTWHQKDILENGNLCIFIACGSRIAIYTNPDRTSYITKIQD